MDEGKQQKLLHMKEAEERKHHSVKLQALTMQKANRMPHTAAEPLAHAAPVEKARRQPSEPTCANVEMQEQPATETHQEEANAKVGEEAQASGQSVYRRKTTQELNQEFKHLSWANVDEFNSFKARQEEKKKAEERMRQQAWLRTELEAQLHEQKCARSAEKKEILEGAKALESDLELWRKQERETQKRMYEKMQRQKEDLDAQMLERQKLQEESKAEQLREGREVLEQVARHLESEKRKLQKAKQQKARAMQEILEVTAAERRMAEERLKREQEEDLRILKLSVQIEKEAAERAKQERLALLSLHQSRADKIAMLATIDKARRRAQAHTQTGFSSPSKLATQSAIKRDAADQARKEAMEKEETARKKAEQLKIQEYLKVQHQEKALQKEREKQERYELQRQQELDAKAFKDQQEMAQRARREASKRQQEALVRQMEERRLRKDLMVSQTEMKLNRRLLEEVNDYLLRQSQAAVTKAEDGE
ncbi:hypothetical protein Efla_000577 [Eimeria flavescens]